MAQRTVDSGFAAFFDSTDGGLPETQFTEFQATGGRPRNAYRTAYVFDAGGAPPPQVRVNTTTYDVTVNPYAAQRTERVRAGTTEAQLAAMMADNTDLVWDENAPVRLTKVLPIRFKNVRWTNAQLRLEPPGHDKAVFLDVVAPGFRVENLAVTGVLGWAWDKEHKGTCDVFHVRNGGSLVCRPVKGGRVTATDFDTFCHVSSGHAGVVIENPEFTGMREYALYQNGGTAGVSYVRAKVDAHGHEPFFRVIDNPRDDVRTANVYVGQCEMHRRANDPVGKDGITPRDCRRFAADSNTLRRCQIRTGQDDQGVADGGSDPDDVLIVGNTVHGAYLDHKKGNGRSRRIHVLRNTFHTPHTQPPVMFCGTTDSVVADNVWVNGNAQWRPQKANENAGLILRNNGNGAPVIDPNVEIRARIAVIDARLAALAAAVAGLQAEQATLQTARADLVSRLI
jgi:hypothetical protein